MKTSHVAQAGFAEKVFAVVTLFLFSDALVIHLRRQAGFVVEESRGDPVLQVVWLAIYTITVGLAIPRFRSVLQSLLADRWLVLLTVLAVATIFWSPEPAVTVRRCGALVGTILLGIHLASRYELEDWLQWLFRRSDPVVPGEAIHLIRRK